jgi:hypothetical protein
MPLRIIDLIEKRKTIVAEWEGERITLVSRPHSRVLGEEINGEGRDWVVEQLKVMVISWDILGEDGKTAPIDDATLRRLPDQCLYAMNKAIVEGWRPNPPSGGSTAAG